MFNANLATTNDKLLCYVMHKHLVIDFKVFAKKFNMDPNPLKLTATSFLDYNKNLTINLLFSH